MKNEQQSQGSQSPNQKELEAIIRGGNFTSQSEANSYLQKHGLSCSMKEDGTADIFEGNSVTGPNAKRLASVQFTGQQDQRQISGINY